MACGGVGRPYSSLQYLSGTRQWRTGTCAKNTEEEDGLTPTPPTDEDSDMDTAHRTLHPNKIQISTLPYPPAPGNKSPPLLPPRVYCPTP